jgi:small subunit ribosomal protein S17
MAEATPSTPARGQRRTEVGVVTSDKMTKTRRVEVARLVKHPRYSKYIKRRTICYVHDEENVSGKGDTVEIMETRPISKLKCWRLVRVVKQAPYRTSPKEEVRDETIGDTTPDSQAPAPEGPAPTEVQ